MILSDYCICTLVLRFSYTENLAHTNLVAFPVAYQITAVTLVIDAVVTDPTDLTSYPVTHTWCCQDYCSDFIACRLDWCNWLLYGVPENPPRKVQSVQNAAARLLTSACRCDHITPLLRQLHWLPVQRRVAFKIVCLVHQSLASLAPTYLTTDIHLVSEYGRRPLRSSIDRTLTVSGTHNRFGDRSFAVARPRLWNSLPISLWQISSYGQFRRYLKIHLYGIWEIIVQCDASFSALYKCSYLLTYSLTHGDGQFQRICMHLISWLYSNRKYRNHNNCENLMLATYMCLTVYI